MEFQYPPHRTDDTKNHPTSASGSLGFAYQVAILLQTPVEMVNENTDDFKKKMQHGWFQKEIIFMYISWIFMIICINNKLQPATFNGMFQNWGAHNTPTHVWFWKM